MLNNRALYLFSLAFITLIGFCVFFSFAFKEHESTLVREKAWEKQQDVGLMANLVDTLIEIDEKNGAGYNYQDIMIRAVRYMDTAYTSTFAQVYDGNLVPVIHDLAPGVNGGEKHNPLDYPEFVEAVRASESGNVSYWYETEEAGKRQIYMTFHWVPTNTLREERYLVTVGISKYTIHEHMSPIIENGIGLLIVVAAIFIISSAVLLSYLGYIYDKREGETKWRARISS